MRQGPVLQLCIDLLDDRVLAVHVISSNSVESILVDGGEECVIPEQVEQWVLPTHAFGFVEFRDTADHQTPRRLQCLFFEVNAVNGTSATSALLIQAPESSS